MSLHKLSAGDGYTYLTRQVAAADDVIITRSNDRRLALSATDFVANGDRWTVASVRADGALDVRHSRSYRRVTLPADYVAEQVQLGYATTVHGAQGQTVDTGHTVLSGTESRQLLYVAVTRGRRENHLYLDLTVPGEDAVMTVEAQRPSTAVEVLTRVIERDDSAVSATTAHRQEHDPVPCCTKRAPSTSTRSPWRANPSSAHRARPSLPHMRKRPSPASAARRHGPPCTPSCSGSR
jgi:hypothetical protein